MLRIISRIIGFALLTSVAFGAASYFLGYTAIYWLNLYAPLSKHSEWTTHIAVLGVESAGVFALSGLALLMAWGTTKSTPSRSLIAVSLLSALAIAILEVIEDIPRSFAPWLSLLLPVAVVVLVFALLKIMAVRRNGSRAMSNQRLERP